MKSVLIGMRVWALMIFVFTCVEMANANSTGEESRLGNVGEMVSAEKRESMRNVFNQVKDKLIIVQCDTSSGSGFIVEMENGTKWFVTNKHVVEGQKRVAAFFVEWKGT